MTLTGVVVFTYSVDPRAERADTGVMAVLEQEETTDAEGHRLWTVRLGAAMIGVAVAGLLGARAAKPVFTSAFGPVDDHETLAWLGRDDTLGWTEIPGKLMNETDAGDWGSVGRWRPAYHTVRLVQTALFGDNPTAWYLSVLTMFAIACGGLGYVVGRWIGVAVRPCGERVEQLAIVGGTAVGAVLAAMLPTWIGILPRLGPSEQLGLVAVAVVAVGLTEMAITSNVRWWLLAVPAADVAVMARETLILVTVLACGVAVVRYWTLRERADAIAGVCLLVPLALSGGVMTRILVSGTDIYGRATGGSRIDLGTTVTDPVVVRSLVASVMAIVAAVGLMRFVEFSVLERRLLVWAVSWAAAAGVVDVWLQAGAYATARYRALVDVVTLLEVAFALCCAVAILVRRPIGRVRWVAALVLGLVVAGGIVRQEWDTASRIEAYATLNQLQTLNFDGSVGYVVDDLDRVDDGQFVLVTTYPLDAEFVKATIQEVWRRRAATDGLQFLAYGIGDVPDDPFLNALANNMHDFSVGGHEPYHISPMSDLDPTRPVTCMYLVTFDAPKAIGPCDPDAAVVMPVMHFG